MAEKKSSAQRDALQKELDDIKVALPHEADGERQREMLRRKGDISREMLLLEASEAVDAETPAKAAAADEDDDTDPVKELNADKAIETIGRMRSKTKLQQVIDNDTRVTVKEAAKQKLASL